MVNIIVSIVLPKKDPMPQLIFDPKFLKPIKFDWVNESWYFLYWEKDTDQPRVFCKRVFNQKWERIIEGIQNLKDWYISVTINRSRRFLHRLVQLVKTGDIEKFKNSWFHLVNHIDWDKLNNSPKNLEWSNPKHNAQHSIKNGLTKINKWLTHQCAREFLILKDNAIVKEFTTVIECIKFLWCWPTKFYKDHRNNIEINWFIVKYKDIFIENYDWEIWDKIQLPTTEYTKNEYFCSSFWRIKSVVLWKWYEKILEPYKNKSWYLLFKIGWKQRVIHKLVMECFSKETDKKQVINHKDWNKENNRLDNLEYVTYSENLNHAYTTWLNKLQKKVNQYSLEWIYIESYDSISKTSKKLNISSWHISNVCSWKKLQTWWFMFRYDLWDKSNIIAYKGNYKNKITYAI